MAAPPPPSLRYCPSIEDKIVRFADKESHQIFLEPEGRNTPELYVQVRVLVCVGGGGGGDSRAARVGACWCVSVCGAVTLELYVQVRVGSRCHAIAVSCLSPPPLSLSHSLPALPSPNVHPPIHPPTHHTAQGFSTGLPERLQLALLRTLPGLESCAMLRPAYAVEYDYLPAHQCHASLETKRFGGLFFSGQLNGTTGELNETTGFGGQGGERGFGGQGGSGACVTGNGGGGVEGCVCGGGESDGSVCVADGSSRVAGQRR